MSDLSKDIKQNYDLGKKLIVDAINIDETLTEILKLEIKRVKKTLNTEYEIDNINSLTKALRNVIITLILTEEKIKTGIILCNINSKDNEIYK